MLRFMLASALVMLIAMGIDVPFLTLSIVVVFIVSMDNLFVTTLVGIASMVGTFTTTVIGIALVAYTLEYPVARIVIASGCVFLGMYIYRLTPLGAMGYIIALCTIYMQSFFDSVSNPEILIRVFLWVGVAGIYPVIVTLIVNHLVLPGDSRKLLPEEMGRQINVVLDQLRAMQRGDSGQEITFSDVERSSQYLRKHFTLAAVASKKIKKNKNRYALRVATLNRLYSASARVSALKTIIPAPAQEFISSLIKAGEAFSASIADATVFAMERELVLEPASALPQDASDDVVLVFAELQEMASALYALAANEASALALQAAEEAPVVDGAAAAPGMQSASGKAKKNILPDDMATNPVYARFACKTLLATLLCYFFYTGVQWDGIHTCMLTCIILALPGLGSTTQKAILRIGGCLIGSVLALLATVFVIPHLDTLGGFMILSLPILGFAAWVNAGSERSNYAGLQIGVAYALAMFGTYGPSADLVEIRDRLIGVLVGVIVSTIIYSLLWPEKERTALKKSMANLLKNIGAILGAHGQAVSEQDRLETIATYQDKAWEELGKARTLKNRVRYEAAQRVAGDDFEHRANLWLASAQTLIPAAEQIQAALPAMRGIDPVLFEKADAFLKSGLAYLEERTRIFEDDALEGSEGATPSTFSKLLDDFEQYSRKTDYAQSVEPLREAMRNAASAMRELSDNPLRAMENYLPEERTTYA